MRLVVIVKSKPLPEGSVRVHGGRKVKKLGGKWVLVTGEGRPASEKEDRREWNFEVGKSYMMTVQYKGREFRRSVPVHGYFGKGVWSVYFKDNHWLDRLVKQGNKYFITSRGARGEDRAEVINVPSSAKVAKEKMSFQWSSSEGLEGKNILYHHTSLDNVSGIFERGLRAGMSTDFKWISFTPKLNYPYSRIAGAKGSMEVSLRFDQSVMRDYYELEEPRGQVEPGELVIKKKAVPVRSPYLKEVLIRIDPSDLGADDEKDLEKLIDRLREKKISYRFVKYTGKKFGSKREAKLYGEWKRELVRRRQRGESVSAIEAREIYNRMEAESK